ncbi:hypothetical protein PIB30_031940 [Stylosanthes scabra]|uniref:Uncharacterized protein n=1 Tax=Stylosanthes scabra TaxID=79078 RepID=A0ABU6QCF4_9FABA|nr:hypothetical protein [Stylosanthes scabra]
MGGAKLPMAAMWLSVNDYTRLRMAIDLVLKDHNNIKSEIVGQSIGAWDNINQS